MTLDYGFAAMQDLLEKERDAHRATERTLRELRKAAREALRLCGAFRLGDGSWVIDVVPSDDWIANVTDLARLARYTPRKEG